MRLLSAASTATTTAPTLTRPQAECTSASLQLPVEAPGSILGTRPGFVEVEDLAGRAEITEARQLAEQRYAPGGKLKVNFPQRLARLLG